MTVDSVLTEAGAQLCGVTLALDDALPDVGVTLRRAHDGQSFVVRNIDGPVAIKQNGKVIGTAMGVVFDAEPVVKVGDELRAI